MKKTSYLLIISIFLLSVSSCDKTQDLEPKETKTEKESVNAYIKEYMSYYYLWNKEIPKELDANSDSKDYFKSMLYKGSGADTRGDKWSFITDDLQGLLANFEGVYKSTGYWPKTYPVKEGSDKFVFVVSYAYENSSAANAGLKRGDIIIKIDGEYLTSKNATSLYYKESYIATIGKYNSETKEFTATDKTVNLKSEELKENPILRDTVYNVDGHKVGYLVYNSFTHNYDKALIEVFEKFKSEGIEELVLDLRYNGGGAVTSAMNLSSMIAPEDKIGKIFATRQYNDDLQAAFIKDPEFGPDFLEDKLTSTAYFQEDTDPVKGLTLPNLNLNRVYIIGLRGTASSSELVINGLTPYMEVKLVGQNTHGKYVGSITLPNEDYKNWAMQPIVLKMKNADGNTDYWNGFAPDILGTDNPLSGNFGYNETEKTGEELLMLAIKDITGGGIVAKKQTTNNIKSTWELPSILQNSSNGMIYDVAGKNVLK
ncbi:MAG: hypothetical protein KAG96_02395 [Ichthyobacteriaceae bacterium]|nr:hypothetical protein [Ichthyobacteriaceae bacterium]